MKGPSEKFSPRQSKGSSPRSPRSTMEFFKKSPSTSPRPAGIKAPSARKSRGSRSSGSFKKSSGKGEDSELSSPGSPEPSSPVRSPSDRSPCTSPKPKRNSLFGNTTTWRKSSEDMRPKEHTGSFQRIEDKEEKGKKLRRTVTGDGISKKERRNSVLLDIVSPRSLNSGDALGTLSKSADVSPRRRREMSPTKYNELLFKSNEFDVHKIKKLSGGTGSGCSVYKAKINGWRCCVKELVKKDSTNFEQDMFRRELTVMRTIESRNVCQYLGYNDDDEVMQMVLSLYDGSVQDLILSRKDVPFKIEEILKIAVQVLNGLYVLHSRRVLHRDIKSENIYYEGELDVFESLEFVIGDFGEAKVVSTSNRAKTVAGSGPFIAPEVLASEKGDYYSFEADCWSCGMFLYELMEQKTPFYDVKGFGVEKRILEGKLPVLSEDRQEMYASLLPVWHALLEFDRTTRMTSGKALLELTKLWDSIKDEAAAKAEEEIEKKKDKGEENEDEQKKEEEIETVYTEEGKKDEKADE